MIWAYAFGYFACYAPYAALTKAVTSGLVGPGVSGYAILPLSTMASLVGMLLFLTAMGWWKFAGHRTVLGVSVPCPGRWTFLSGLCTAGIIATTTLAYTLEGVSIVFMMLLMRGGVLVIAPVVDFISRRHVRWFSWVALALTLAALVVATLERSRDPDAYRLSLLAIVDVAVYLVGYFVRLRFMSRMAKTNDPEATKRYFVEEQMVATPAIVLLLAIGACFAEHGKLFTELRAGFTDIWSTGIALQVIVIGILSQGTGVFGGLILLDRRENTFCVPVNRASSIIAGVLASFSLTWIYAKPAPSDGELASAVLIIIAIVLLSIPSLLQAREARRVR